MTMYFKNLATYDKDYETINRVSKECSDELEVCGIKIFDLSSINCGPQKGEVPTNINGHLSLWRFERAWRYWIARGPGIPLEAAEILHRNYGQECRVDGHAGCPSPREWFKGFGVGVYHVDSLNALQALANVIKDIDPTWEQRK